jgi:hypothetical protein
MSRTPRHRIATLLVALGLFAALVSTLGVAGANAQSTSAGKATVCAKTSIAAAVARAGKAQGTTASLGTGSFKCASGWAYANANVGPAKHGVAVTFVFKQAGSAWKLANRAIVCKPSAKLVPATLFKAACTTN